MQDNCKSADSAGDMSRVPPRSGTSGEAELRDLLARIARVNPTGRGRRPGEERVRYEEKARLQSLLIEGYPGEVRAQAHGAMPGIVSLAVPRLRASAAHAVIEALSDRARAWVEEQLRAATEVEPARGRAPSAPLAPRACGGRRLARAAELIGEFDFECAEAELSSLAADASEPAEERARALLMLIELHVDHLADDVAALALEPALRALAPLPEKAHELLGVAARRAGDERAALRHLRRCGGERAAVTLASLARERADARAWAAATEAWARLQAIAMTADPPLPAPVEALRDGARRHLEDLAARAEARDLEVDEDLVRFVREIFPAHPWLRERRESAQKSRSRASARALLDRAQSCVREGDLPGVEHALALLPRHAPSPSDAAELEDLAAWVEDRREGAQASRALTLAEAGDLEAACRVYSSLSARAREQVRGSAVTPVFSILDALHAASPEGAGSRALVRAAAAWVAAQAQADAPRRWSAIEPHSALLEGVPGLAEEVRALRVKACPEPTPALPSPPSRSAAGRWEARVDGVRFSEVPAPAGGASETMEIGPFAVRTGTTRQVVTLESLGERGALHLSLRTPGGQARPRWIQVEGLAAVRAGCLLTTDAWAALVDGSGALWMLTFAPEMGLRKLDLGVFFLASQGCEIVAVNGNVLAIGARSEAGSPCLWRLVDARTGGLLHELSGPGIFRARTARGWAFHRMSGARVERLGLAGESLGGFELPWGVAPSAIIESPFVASPVLLAPLPDQRATMLWWQPAGRFFRAFELFDAADHGAPIDAVALSGRAVCVVTRRSDGATFLHLAHARKSTLRPAGRPIELPGHLGLVADASGRRGWTVRRSPEGGVEIRPLPLRDEQV